MSAELKNLDTAERLRRLMVRRIGEETGLREQLALVYADIAVAVLQETHGGEVLYIPAAKREYPVEKMRAALESGMPKREVCRRYGVSGATLRRLTG